MRSTRLFPVLALALFAACSESTAPSLPTPFTFGPAAWALASVNGKPVSQFSTAQAYSFRANPTDVYNTRAIPVSGTACTTAAGRFILQREVIAFVDTATRAPFLPDAAPFSGYRTTEGTATAIAPNTWQLADGMTARRAHDSLTVTFTREGPAVYLFLDGLAPGRYSCILAGY